MTRSDCGLKDRLHRCFASIGAVLVCSAPLIEARGQNLQDFGGPIMQAPRAYMLFWLPKGNHFDSSGAAGDLTYMSTIANFFADSSAGTYLNILSEYPGTCSPPDIPTAQSCFGTVTTSEFVYLDSRPYPHAGTVTDPLQDADVQQEITNFLNQSNVVPSLSTEFFVFTGANITECRGPNNCAYQEFCAYHQSFRLHGNPVIYSYMADPSSPPGCLGIGKAPNQLSADDEILVSSHEFAESITDPLWAEGNPAWFDPTSGAEIGDLCAWQVGPLNPDGSNVSLNGHPYVVQELWDNDGAGCASSFSPAITGRTAEVTTTTGSTALNANSAATANFREVHGSSQSVTLHAANVDPQWNMNSTFAKVFAQPSLGSGFYQWSLSDVGFSLVAGGGAPTQWPLTSVVVKLRNPNGTLECEQFGSGTPLGTVTTSAPYLFTTPGCEPAPAYLTVSKFVTGGTPTDRFNLQIDGTTVLADTHNGSTGALVESYGTHSVGETAGPGTNLTNFTTSITGACSSNGSVTLAPGDNKTCTIYNVGHPILQCPSGDRCCKVSEGVCDLCVGPGQICP